MIHPVSLKGWDEPLSSEACGQDLFLSAQGHFIRAFFANGPQRPGILVCRGLGDEAYHAKRQVEGLISECTARGLPCMSFDFFGCGESEGELIDARPGDWLGDLQACCAFLEQRGVETIFIVGVRFGAAHALHAADRIRSVAGVVLWEPVISLKRQLRRLRLNARIAGLQTGEGGRNTAGDGTSVEARCKVGAFTFSIDQLEELDALGRSAGRGNTSHGYSTLVVSIGRSGTSPDVRALVGRMVNSRCEHEHHRFVPFWESVRYEESKSLNSLTLDWVAAKREVGERDRSADRHLELQVTACGTSCKVGTIETEEIVRTSDYSLGTLHRSRRRVRDTAVLLLPGERRDSTGPGRLLVTAARSLSREGYPVLRLGSRSPSRFKAPPSVLTRLRESWQAMDELRRRTKARNLCVVGLCSGGGDALLLADLLNRFPTGINLDHVVLWSPPAEYQQRAAHQRFALFMDRLKPYLRKLSVAETWAKLISGRLHPRSILAALRGEAARKPPRDPIRGEESPVGLDPRVWRSWCEKLLTGRLKFLAGFSGQVSLIRPQFDAESRIGASWYASQLSEGVRVEELVVPGATHNFPDADHIDDLVLMTLELVGGGRRGRTVSEHAISR